MKPGYSCGWDLVHACDYRCPYCFFIPSWTNFPDETNSRHLGVKKDEWVAFWKRCSEQLGSFTIEIAGGEPFQHPDALAIMAAVAKDHKLHVVTNLSIGAQTIAAALDPARVALSASFHPTHADLETFAAGLRALKKKGFSVTSSIVAYPPHLVALGAALDRIKREDVACYLNPYQGTFAGREYPRGYSKAEADFIRANTFLDELDIRMRDARPRGKLCAAGWKYFRVWPDGVIHRCCAATELNLAPLGHIRDARVPVLNQAEPCPADKCFAPNELAMLVES